MAGDSQLLQQMLPFSRAVAINLASDTTLASTSRGIFVGGAGNLAITTQGNDAVTFTGVTAGTIYAIRAKVIKSTANGTTATNIVALW